MRSSARNIDKIKKYLWKLFNNNGLSITIEVNKKVVNFLDTTLNLDDNKYKPYNKPGNIPTYVHSGLNHPPSILKNIPDAINRRLTTIASDENAFNSAKELYQQALNKSKFNYELAY